jgi:hypothetical protein
MENLLIKLLVAPAIIGFCSALFPQVAFQNFAQILGVGWLLALVGYLVDRYLVIGDLDIYYWWPTILEGVVATLIVYLAPSVLTGVTATFLGALLTGILIGFSEHITHMWLRSRASMVRSKT